MFKLASAMLKTARVSVIVSLALLAGCESPAEKAERLRKALLFADLDVLVYEQKKDSIEKRTHSKQDSVVLMAAWDSVFKARATRDVAQRDVNRFMSGR